MEGFVTAEACLGLVSSSAKHILSETSCGRSASHLHLERPSFDKRAFSHCEEGTCFFNGQLSVSIGHVHGVCDTQWP